MVKDLAVYFFGFGSSCIDKLKVTDIFSFFCPMSSGDEV